MTRVTVNYLKLVTAVTGQTNATPLCLKKKEELFVVSKSFKGGILLIVAGIFLLLNQLGVLSGQVFLFMLSLGFIATYVLLGARKEYGNVGFLIPGTILFAIAAYAAVSDSPGFEGLSPAYFFIGLSLSFLAVFLIHTFWFKNLVHGERFWPVYPAAGLLLLAGIIGLSVSGQWAEHLGLLNYLWIVALIAVGIWMVIKSVKRS
jgi:hypothetical protein